jgi:pimeloyl-ACP methyl ester carboxylesterase
MSAAPTGRVLDINGSQLYVEEHGDGAPLVLVHGGLGSGAVWSPAIPLLADRFHVVIPDSRGHGRSTNPTGRLSYPALADDLAALLAALELDRPIVAGWSDGGQISLELAARHPTATGPIVVGGAYPDFVSTGLREAHRQLLGADAAGVPDLQHLDTELGDEADDIKALHHGGAHHWSTLIEQTASMWLDYPGLPPSQVAAIDQPALVLAGDRDDLIPLDLSVALYRALPHAEFAVIPFADHSAAFTPERAMLFAGAIADFALRHAKD